MEGSRQVAVDQLSRTPLVHLINARSSHPPRFHAPFTQHIHALGRVMPGPACRLPSASDGSPPDCAVTAQIAHSKYAGRYARLVCIRVRTGSRFALRFARLVRTLLREPGANSAAGLLSKFTVARRWFPLRFPPNAGILTGNLSVRRNSVWLSGARRLPPLGKLP